MTVDQILKLDTISTGNDLTWRRWSYDAGHPECLCSACGTLIQSSEYYLDKEDYFDSAGVDLETQLTDNFPIRFWQGHGKKMTEAILHTACFKYLKSKGVIA